MFAFLSALFISIITLAGFGNMSHTPIRTGTVKGTTYYIDTKGSDTNAGKSEAKPWADFANITKTVFKPGDKILLKRGCVWHTQLTINAQGSTQQLIRIGAYGIGKRPKIELAGNPGDICVKLNNACYLSLSGIEVSNGGAGIVLYYDHSYNNRSVYLDDLIAHDFKGRPYNNGKDGRVSWSYGIGVTGVEGPENDQTRVLTGLQITNTEVYNTGAGISLDWGNHHCADGTTALANKFGDVDMEHINLHDNTVDPVSFVSLFITSVTNCTIKNAVINNGTKFAPSGTAAIQIMFSVNVTLQNVTVTNTAFNACPDNAAVDFECNNKSPVIDHCTFKNNAGPAIEFLATPDYADPLTLNATIKNCVFINNDWAKKQGGYQIAVPDWVHGQIPTGKIFNNRYQNTNNIRFFGGTGNTAQLGVLKNINIGK